jgi:hypothetical protein
MLEESLVQLASLFRQHDEAALARWIEGTASGDRERLPQRVLQMFTHGMGGLMDRALYTGGELDKDATNRRDALAQKAYEEAMAQLR